MNLSHQKLKIITFEEKLLTDTEREERNKEKEEDKALAAYYRSIFEDPESFLKIEEPSEDDILDDDTYIWDEDI